MSPGVSLPGGRVDVEPSREQGPTDRPPSRLRTFTPKAEQMTSTVHALGSQRTPAHDALDQTVEHPVDHREAVTPRNRNAVSQRLLERAALETDPLERKRLQDE